MADEHPAYGPLDGWPQILAPDNVLVASAPLAAGSCGAAAFPASQYGFWQQLFGFEAQLHAFDHALRRRGQVLALAPLPELFSASRSRAIFNPCAAGPSVADARVADLIHLRFGPARHARVLKGARNVLVLADDPSHLLIGGTAHPFGSDTQVPAPFATVLTYAPRRAMPLSAGGGILPLEVLEDTFLGADLDAEATGRDHRMFESVPQRTTVAGLQVGSFAEFMAAKQSDNWAIDGAATNDWRRTLALAYADEAPRPYLVLVPWNLANPASLIPDLVLKLTRRTPREAALTAIVLFPFNATPTTGPAVADLIAAAGAHAGASAAGLRTLFLARLTSLRDAYRLRRIFPLAWLESNDPESCWTSRRLARLGIASAVLGTEPAVPPSFAIALDESIRHRLCDGFGERFYDGRTLSARQLAALLIRSRDAVSALGVRSESA